MAIDNGPGTIHMTTLRGTSAVSMLAQGGSVVDWYVSNEQIPYNTALTIMEQRCKTISQNNTRELVWLLEHPPLYSAGTSAQEKDLLDSNRFPIYKTGRGGQYTYHGPGQRVAYVMLDLNRRRRDIRAFVATLEDWLIATLKAFGVEGERRNERIGVWIRRPDKGENMEDKIAALGIRVCRWITQHGISINISPQLNHFDGIVPCGVQKYGITSLVDLGINVTMSDVDTVLRKEFEQRFGPTQCIQNLTSNDVS